MPIHLARPHAPMINAATVKEEEFLRKMRRQLINTIRDMSSVAMNDNVGSDAIFNEKRYFDFENVGRDLSPLHNHASLQEAAKSIIRSYEDVLKGLPQNRLEAPAIQQIMGQTIAFLNKGL